MARLWSLGDRSSRDARPGSCRLTKGQDAMVRRASLVATLATFLLVACGGAQPPPAAINAGSAINNGSTVISMASTYNYSLRAPGCQYFELSSDSGKVDWLGSRGAVYLTVGNWSGSCHYEAFTAPPPRPYCTQEGLTPLPPSCYVPQFGTSFYPSRPTPWSLTLRPAR
jgi:hypothetical protein